MNEEIRKLAIETDVWCDQHFPYDPNYNIIWEQKFAELIIQECEKVAKDPQWYSVSPSNGWRNPINHVCNVMKEHFGVEK